METQPHYTEAALLTTWEKIGNENCWIQEAIDPPFNKSCLKRTHSIEELQTAIGRGNWCLGQGFYYQNLCFINQVDGGDEWLTIRDDLAFESITFYGIIQRGAFEKYIHRMLNATREQLKKLEY